MRTVALALRVGACLVAAACLPGADEPDPDPYLTGTPGGQPNVAGPPESADGSPEEPAGEVDRYPRIPAREACAGAGYLCLPLDGLGGEEAAEGEGLRVQRWPDTQGILRVRLHPPPVADPELREAVRRAAVHGLMAWHDLPFPLRVLDRPGVDTDPADVEIGWERTLEGGELGQVRARWRAGADGGVTFEVESFVLALELGPPHSRSLTPDEIRRAAAHEMGHALGLGHSDSPGDLMYPSNTAHGVSPRDYRTLEALYALPNGAIVVP